MVPVDGRLAALDHDWHVAGVVPSVMFVSEIPKSPYDSFYNGKVFVTSKDRIFMPSSPNRHGAESLSTLREHYSQDNVTLDKKILLLYSDGGPDHRVTYGSVQVALICLFLSLDVNMLVAVRTCPGQSWVNLAERCMSLLNLCLQGVALMRDKAADEFEQKIVKQTTMQEMRSLAGKCVGLKEAFGASIKPVIDLLNQHFKRMKLKGEPMVAAVGAEDEEIDKFFSTIALIDETLEVNKLRKADLEGAEEFAKFFREHCKPTNYTFQVKKCLSSDCVLCSTIQPPRLADEQFQQLHFLPDPVLKDKESYKSFEELHGTSTTDADRPSLQSRKFRHPADDQHKWDGLFVSAKVRDVISCGECKKSRCIHSAKKLTKEEEIAIARIKEDQCYDCGSPLFPEGHPLADRAVVMQSLGCASEMEPSYYSANVKFPDCCYYCGQSDTLFDRDSDYMKALTEQYAVVRPLCKPCKLRGKSASVRGPKQKRQCLH